MALINCIEPMNIGQIFLGIGGLILFSVISWILFRIYKKVILWWDSAINREEKYNLFEEITLDKMAEEKGINLNAELIKKELLKKEKKSFRKKLEEQIYENMFGKEDRKK